MVVFWLEHKLPTLQFAMRLLGEYVIRWPKNIGTLGRVTSHRGMIEARASRLARTVDTEQVGCEVALDNQEGKAPA